MLDNMANIDLLQRQQAVKWPEFSWETGKGSENPNAAFRCLPDISRLDTQMKGECIRLSVLSKGSTRLSRTMNVEVTVTGQRAVNEPIVSWQRI